MRTLIQRENTTHKVIIYFTLGGWTFSYFDGDSKEMDRWVDAMRQKHGTIKTLTRTRIKNVRKKPR